VERNEDLDLSHDDSENSSSEELAQWRTPNRLRSLETILEVPSKNG